MLPQPTSSSMAVTPRDLFFSFIFCSASNLLDLFCLPFNVSRNKYNQPSHILMMISILHYDVWETRFYHSLLFSDFVVHIIFRIAAWFTSWYNFFCIEFFNLPLFAKCSFLFDFFLFCWNIPIFYWNIVDCCMFLSYCWYNFSELLHTYDKQVLFSECASLSFAHIKFGHIWTSNNCAGEQM